MNYDIKVPADLLLDLKNNYGNLTILDIENNVSALSRYSQTEVKNIGKDLKLNTEYSSVDLENISGDLFLNSRYGAVEIDKLKGQGQLKSGYTAVNISGIQGDLTGEMKYGELTLKNPEQSVQLEGTYTDLNLIFDDILINHEFNCITRYGDIKSELGIPIISSGNEKKMEGKIGRGKNNISLETKYGDINITKSYSVK